MESTELKQILENYKRKYPQLDFRVPYLEAKIDLMEGKDTNFVIKSLIAGCESIIEKASVTVIVCQDLQKAEVFQNAIFADEHRRALSELGYWVWEVKTVIHTEQL